MQQNVRSFEKGFWKSLLMIKTIEKLQTIVILQVNMEVQHIVYVI